MTCIKDCESPRVLRDYLFVPNWELRYCYDNIDTQYVNLHRSYSQDFEFNSAFHSLLGVATNIVASYASDAGHGNLQWIGTLGAYNCKPLCYSSGKALDFSAFDFNNTSFDMYNAWRDYQPLAQQSGYLAIWASLRIYCTTVLTNAYDSYHLDHIHADNGDTPLSTPPPIRQFAHTDTSLVQTSCNLLNDANILVDGKWGSATTQAYNDLIAKFGMDCLSPMTNYWDARTFLILILRHGFASVAAGTYSYSYCN